MILEPIMMNAGIIHPLHGYLAGLKDLLHEHDALLTFDEVKTGLTAGPGGATGIYDVVPDLTCLAKAIGGGVSIAAIGGREGVMAMIADGRYDQVGTFNGNPLAIASARPRSPRSSTTLHTPTSTRCASGSPTVSTTSSTGTTLPGVSRPPGPRDASRSCPSRCATSASSGELDGRYGHAHWLVQHNRGAFLPPWGKIEQWLISVQHTDDDVDQFVDNTEHLADRLLGPSA